MLQKKYILPIMLLVQILVLQIISLFPRFVEDYYSNGIYVGISNLSRIVFGWIPFSIGDIIYFLVIFLLLRWLWKIRKSFKANWKDHVLKVLSFFSIFYFLFNFLWGVNYHRVPLFEKMEIKKEYTDAELLAFTKTVIAKTNEIHMQIVMDKNLKVAFPYSQQEVFEKNVDGYAELAKIHPYFFYDNTSVKKSIISLPLSYMGFAGYLNPFTNEAQVNDKLPMYSFPATAAHEMAHQIGYASESEANFIGFLASVKNKDLYMQYSGYTMALRYCLGNWEVRDESILDELLATVNPGIRGNFRESRTFWDQYETFIEEGFKIFYDNFLKLNSQEEGLDSYSKFVDLMVNYYKNEKL